MNKKRLRIQLFNWWFEFITRWKREIKKRWYEKVVTPIKQETSEDMNEDLNNLKDEKINWKKKTIIWKMN